MADGRDHLAERVKTLEDRMDQLPAMLEQRFGAVDAAIAEQRQFTEFVFEELQRRLGSVQTRVGSVETRLGSVETRLGGVETGLGGVDTRLRGVDTRLRGVDTRLDRVEAGQRNLETGLQSVTAGLARVERKLDQFIDRYPPPNTAPPS